MEFDLGVTKVDLQQIFGDSHTSSLCVCDYDREHVLIILDGKKYAVPAKQLLHAVTCCIREATRSDRRYA